MARTAPLAMAAAIGLLGPGRDLATPNGSTRTAAREALAAKADLPAALPLLPSLLTDPDAGRPDVRDDRRNSRGESRGVARKAARANAEDAHARDASAEAARAAEAADADAQGAAEKKNEAKVKKEKKPKPPHPPKGKG